MAASLSFSEQPALCLQPARLAKADSRAAKPAILDVHLLHPQWLYHWHSLINLLWAFSLLGWQKLLPEQQLLSMLRLLRRQLLGRCLAAINLLCAVSLIGWREPPPEQQLLPWHWTLEYSESR